MSKPKAGHPHKSLDPFIALVLGLLVPGAGHIYIGKKLKAVIIAVTINLTILTGLWMGMWKTIFIERLAFLAQWGGGVLALFSAAMARHVGIHSLPAHQYIPLLDVGTLYTSAAGLLNMIVALNAMLAAYELNKATEGGDRK